MDRFASSQAIVREPRPCPFCAIAAGVGQADLVVEDATGLAFLDRNPLLPGHVLLIPRAHVEVLPQADDACLASLGLKLRDLVAAVPHALGADGAFVAQNNVVSQSVPHLHFHIVPRWKDDRLFSNNLSWKRVRYAPGQAAAIAADIRAALAGLKPS